MSAPPPPYEAKGLSLDLN